MTERTQIVTEAIQRFPQLPTRTISRYILYNYGDIFGNNLETIRDAVRRRLGAHGENDRKRMFVLPRTTPVVMPQTWRKPRNPYNLPVGLWLLLPDIHVPMHEPRPVEAAISYGQKHKVNGVLLNGDAQDCISESFWLSERKRDSDKEIELFIDFLDFLRHEFPKQKIVYKPGNHEYRLPRYYQKHMPDLIGLPLLAMEATLGFELRDIEYLDYRQIVNAGKLPILHGHEIQSISKAINPARGLFNKIKSWGLCSHCHQTSEHNAKNIRGQYLTTWSTGCLCDLQPDYNPYGNDWNWGFALINVEKNGDFEVENRRILPSGKVV